MTAKFMIEKIQKLSSKGVGLYGRVVSGTLLPAMAYEGASGTLRIERIFRVPSSVDGADLLALFKPLAQATETDGPIALALRGPADTTLIEGMEIGFIEKEPEEVKKRGDKDVSPGLLIFVVVVIGFFILHDVGICAKHSVLDALCTVSEGLRSVIDKLRSMTRPG